MGEDEKKSVGAEYSGWIASDVGTANTDKKELAADYLKNLTKDQLNDLSAVGALSWRPIGTAEQGTLGPLKDLIEGNFNHNDETMLWREQQAREVLGLTSAGINAENTESTSESPVNERSQAEQVNIFAEGVAGGVSKNAMDKIKDYDQRIRAALEGRPVNPTDDIDNLKRDFQQSTQIPWSEDFNLNEYNNDYEAQRRALRVKPIEIQKTEENPGIERRRFSPDAFEFKNENGKVVEYYSGTKNREITDGTLEEINVNGESYKIIISSDPASPHMQYEPSRNIFQIGPDAIAEYKQDPEMFLSSFMHESAHKEYFSLTEEKQRALDGLIKDSPRLKVILGRFAAALYGDKMKIPDGREGGKQYLDVHDKDNTSTKQNTLSPDGQYGLKDTRTIALDLDGQQHEVFVGMLVTEMISLMSSLEVSKGVYNKVAERGRALRGGEDPRYDIVKMFHDEISKDAQIKQYFDELDLFRTKKPEFVAEIEGIIKK